ncbi:hypothetical protein [Roseisolibacter agri]|uniref:DUF11 domain-containing protein n=1 Tax=Roseisolibacter agri TaxID=2014610 RepID=A0AA37QE62_9BACT|nr:hypothetical protein [Roseisolibacter agri]GLC24098.1 hypothetical protein rosag_06110 [Roseisolibacter agri]
MSRTTVAARSIAALASLALLAACGDRSGPAPLEPRDAPAFVSAGSQSSDWQQCANNGRNDAIPCEWINSVLNPGKATYREGELIPFRFAIHVVDIQGKKQVAPDTNTVRKVTFTYGFNKATNGNYDFIGKFNQTEGVRANLCSADFSPVNNVYCAPGTPAGTLLPTYGQPSPPYTDQSSPAVAARHTTISIGKTVFLSGLTGNLTALRPALDSALTRYLAKGGKLEIDVFGGVGVGVDNVTYNVGGSDVTATMTVRFRARQKDVLMAFGAHFARLQDWQLVGYGGGAGQSGSPFHIKVDSIDGTGVGALGNNVSGGVVVPQANVTLGKSVSDDTISVGEAFSWTIRATNSGDGDAANVQIVDTLPVITGYTFSTPSAGCAIASGILTCGPLTVAAGTFREFTVSASFTGTVTPATSCGSFPNTARLGGTGGASPTITLTVQCPNLNLVKVAGDTAVSAGNPISFVLTLNNLGPGIAIGATLKDTLPTGGGIVWSVDTEHSDTTCAISGNVLSCSFGDLAASGTGASRSVRVTSPTTSASCQAYPNRGWGRASNHAAVQASDTTTVLCPSIDITKVADSASVSAGSQIGFRMVVTNNGQGTATGVTLTDVLPTNSGLNWSLSPTVSGCTIASGTLTCSFGDLAPAATRTVHLVSPTDSSSCGTVSNKGKVTTTNNGADSATASIAVNCPDLRVTKSAGQDPVSAGMSLEFTIQVRNAATTGSATGVTLNDPLPGGSGVSWSISPAVSGCGITGSAPTQTLACTLGTLAPGASVSVRIVSSTTAASCKTYPNTATADATNHAAVQASDTITVQCPSLDLTKTADSTPVSAGSQIGFTLTVTNAVGAGTATAVVLTDTLPTNTGLGWSISPTNAACGIANGVLTCNFGSLLAGGSASVHVISSTAFASCGTVSNKGRVATGNNGTDSASASVTVQCPNVTLTKTADSTTVSAGSPIGFTITVSNAGPGVAKGVSLNDALPGGSGVSWSISPSVSGCGITGNAPTQTLNCTFGDLAASGAGATRSVHVSSSTTSASCKAYENVATATSTNHASLEARDTTTVLCPSLDLTKVADSTNVSAGNQIGFRLVVKNTGAGTATGVTVKDTLPTNSGLGWSVDAAGSTTGCAIAGGILTCNFGTLGPSDSARVHVTSGTAFASCGTVNNRGWATTSNNGTDSASASLTVRCPNLTIQKTPDTTGDPGYLVNPGDSARFTIKVKNTGTGAALNTVLTDTLPAGLTWSDDRTQCPSPIPSITVGGVSRQLLTCNIGTLAASDSFVVKVAALVPTNFLLPPTSSAVPALEIDGNLTSNGGPDWATLPDTLLKCTTPKLNCNIDTPTGPADSSFGQGTKEDTPVPSVVSGSIPNNKADLQRFYLTTRRVLVGGVVHDVLYLAWERVQQPSGTTNMDFELNQLTTLSANGVTPTRKAGDVLVKYDLSKGGGTLALGVHRWVETGNPATVCQASNTVPCWGKVDSLVAPTGTGASNTPAIGQVQDPIAPGSRMLDTLTFGEAAIDLQGAGIFQAGTCLVFGRAYLKSRSSDAFTSEIKDFIAPIPIDVENCPDRFINNQAWVKASNFSPAAGISDTARIRISAQATASLPTTRTGELAVARRLGGGAGPAAVASAVTAVAAVTLGGPDPAAYPVVAHRATGVEAVLGSADEAWPVRAASVRHGGRGVERSTEATGAVVPASTTSSPAEGTATDT